MRWVAIRAGGQVVEEFDAPGDREIARAVAWSKWGTTVTHVMSLVEHKEHLREQQAMDRERQRREDTDA
jgi:hypothetical protein